MRVNGLVRDKIFFEADTGPNREPVKFLAKVFTAQELVTMRARVFLTLAVRGYFFCVIPKLYNTGHRKLDWYPRLKLTRSIPF